MQSWLSERVSMLMNVATALQEITYSGENADDLVRF
jgi:hypothetical protein